MTITLVLALLVGINVWATRRILRSDESSHRKSVFIASVWIMPFVGALIAKDYAPSRQDAASRSPKSKQPLPKEFQRDPAPKELGLQNESPFDVIAHAAAVNGVPVLDWKALGEWVSSLAGEERKSEATNLGRRAWLLHLRDAAGPHFNLYESEQAYILSSLEPHVVIATAQYVATTRDRISRVLQGIARFPPKEKAILLIFDDDSSYYQYVSTYYPEDGEFALSGGMFINFGCPHFVVKRADLAAIEPVIAHEMTHMALSYLALPTWLDEGIAVNLERRLTHAPPLIYTLQELHEMHSRFWNDERIQEFWSGKSFRRTDEGNLLSYELARILVEHMGRDWALFARFVSAAKRVDAGAGAAQDLLAINLGACVCALLEVESTHHWSPNQLVEQVEG